MIRCVNHPIRFADYHCSTCQVGLCKDCISVRPFDRGRIQFCPRCSNGAVDLAPYKPVAPFWTKLPDLILWPLGGGGWMLLVAWSIVSLVLLGLGKFGLKAPHPIAFFSAIVCYLIYYGFLISYFYRIIALSEDGKFKVPDFAEFPGIGGSFLLVVNFVIAIVSVFWPSLGLIVGGGFVGSVMPPAGLIMMVVGCLIFLPSFLLAPMSVLVMGVFRNIANVINPVFLVVQIKKIVKEYFIAVAILAGVLVLNATISLVVFFLVKTLESMLLGAFALIVDGVLQLYTFMVIGHLLGYLAYQTRYQLKWWPESQNEPVFMVAGRPVPASALPVKVELPGMAQARMGAGFAPAAAGGVVAAGAAMMGPGAGVPARPGAPRVPAPAPGLGAGADDGQEELSRQVNDGMAMLNHGRYEDAYALFKEIIEQNPNHLGGLRGMVQACLRLDQLDEARGYAQSQGAALAGIQAFDQLWEMYAELKKRIPKLALLPKDLFNLARWLVQQDQAMEAAKTLRELGVTYPDDPLAPKAMYQCAEILWRKLAKTDAALQMFDYILKRYPDSPFRDQIARAMAEIKSASPT